MSKDTPIIPTDSSARDVIENVMIGDRISVEYEPTRGKGTVTKEGRVVDFNRQSMGCKIVFKREDGQTMKIDGQGGCYSIGSHYPYNGNIVDVQLER